MNKRNNFYGDDPDPSRPVGDPVFGLCDSVVVSWVVSPVSASSSSSSFISDSEISLISTMSSLTRRIAPATNSKTNVTINPMMDVFSVTSSVGKSSTAETNPANKANKHSSPCILPHWSRLPQNSQVDQKPPKRIEKE
jgi:hypothetical protein